jgi:hypothetical protein
LSLTGAAIGLGLPRLVIAPTAEVSA